MLQTVLDRWRSTQAQLRQSEQMAQLGTLTAGVAHEINTPIAPVNTPENIVDDPQFQARFKILPHEEHGADMLAFPVNFIGEELPEPPIAPTVGEHNDEVLRDVLGYDDARVAQVKDSGALGTS